MNDYDKNANDSADQHSQMMQEQRKGKIVIPLEWQKSAIKYNTYKIKDSKNEK